MPHFYDFEGKGYFADKENPLANKKNVSEEKNEKKEEQKLDISKFDLNKDGKIDAKDTKIANKLIKEAKK